MAYNTFINCKGYAEWVGENGDCDGGALEVSAASGGTIQNVHMHHNFSYNNCGMLEIASYFGDAGRGIFQNSSFHHNVSIDSGWMGLLQVANTDMHNVEFYNNTLVQREGSTNTSNGSILWIIYTATASGMSGGKIYEDSIYLTNNLVVLDGVSHFQGLDALWDPAAGMDGMEPFNKITNLVLDTSEQDPGFVNTNGTTPEDFDLVSGSPAIDAGTNIAGNTLDFFNRERTVGASTDIGAYEYGATSFVCSAAVIAGEGRSHPPLRRSSLASRPAAQLKREML